jgi:hypothetical protein
MPKKKSNAVKNKKKNAGGEDGGELTPMAIMQSKFGMIIATFLTVFYLMYVQLTKKAMDIFNCAAMDPPDDPNNPTTYMSIAPDQECWRPGTWETGMHVKLMPWAIVFVICYSLAFPMFMFFKFQKNKLKIFEDQLLAAQDRGEKPSTNINFSFRKSYSSMYKNYKPDKWYWPIVILAKKLAICFTSLLFRRNPSFQLAVALMVLFTAFTFQVLNRPFMSMDERAEIVRLASRRDFERGSKMLRKMAAFGGGGDVEKAKKRLAMEEQAQLTIAKALTLSAKYFVNYNQVEAVFLGCAIYVCLAGVMFSSGYFVNEYYWYQRDGLGYLTLAIVLVSTGYYFYVIGLEVTGVRKYRRQKNKAKWTAFKKKANFHKDLFNLNNGNASEEEKSAAAVIAACMKGRLARHSLHERIMNGNNEEDKIILARIEARVAERREQVRLKRGNKNKKKNVPLPMLKKKKLSKLKKNKTKKSSNVAIVPVQSSKVEEKSQTATSKGKSLAGWGGDESTDEVKSGGSVKLAPLKKKKKTVSKKDGAVSSSSSSSSSSDDDGGSSSSSSDDDEGTMKSGGSVVKKSKISSASKVASPPKVAAQKKSEGQKESPEKKTKEVKKEQQKSGDEGKKKKPTKVVNESSSSSSDDDGSSSSSSSDEE